ncbi:HAD family phosphatase [Streptococcus chenjunshii]|uniref:HAD family phosphatase n=1 Tax=Streptococcus chenjunshii TaxID=2173853 RepID=A0A372KK25_9STRE|nr:Cof-type HAD-IIB family hydrolase [Streptococcus chenjunshii]AXQ78938.1 HAD family phosphatase [Streptococcus chenjunshii]RFU50391.1 HAD family phosphatase [Streptococcus chenjunshii]RFU52620.1 HAD family phosphatase [Streptococcus chenjunshii]
MSDIKLIISDIDGTILDSQHQLDSKLKRIVAKLKQRSIPFILASARSPYGMEPLAQTLGLEDIPMACYNGALIVQKSENSYRTLYENPLDKTEISELLRLLKKNHPQIAISAYAATDWLVEEKNQWIELEAEITGETPFLVDFDDLFTRQTSVHKLLLIAEAEDIQKLYLILQKRIFKHTHFYLSKDNYLEVTAKTVSKDEALKELAAYYNLNLKQTMAIGDNYNDLPMLKLAGLGVAMGNAPEAIQACADIIAKSNDQNGVSEVIADCLFEGQTD